MNLQNGYKVLYAEAVDGNRIFKASKSGTLNDADTIATVEIGKYRLIFEKDGSIFGSESGRVEDGVHIEAFDNVFCCDHVDEDENTICDVCKEEVPAKAYTGRTRKNEVTEEPAAEEPVVEETPAEAEPVVEEPEAEEPVVVEE